MRAAPDDLRDPDSVGETFAPTDGGTHVGPRTDGGRAVDDAVPDEERAVDAEVDTDGDRDLDDPWAAERFLDDIDHGAYGTDAATLRDGLDVVARADQVLVSPGMPFVVPMAVGLVVSLTYGDTLFALLGAVGLV